MHRAGRAVGRRVGLPRQADAAELESPACRAAPLTVIEPVLLWFPRQPLAAVAARVRRWW
ncbi:MAG: hypothetical protein EOO78_14270 [Oxalobacteraceae bacterium]|nr:MAG: hypothetical protein EOO78_14270 [Oxalobacteraceae bacterium]